MKKNECRLVIFILISIVELCFVANSAFGATVTWTFPTFQPWTCSSCWSSGSVPTASDDVVFPESGVTGAFISTNVGEINSLSIEGGSISFSGEGDLSVATTLNVEPANINSLTIGNSVTSGGILRLHGPVAVDSGARINLNNGGTLQVNDTLTVNSDYFNVYGTLELNGTLQGLIVVTLSPGSALTGTDGTINITSPGYLSVGKQSNITWGGSLTNQGEIHAPYSSVSRTINANNLTFINNGLFLNEGYGGVNINDFGGSNSFINNGSVESTGAISFNIPFTNNTGGTVFGKASLSFGSTFTNNSGGILTGYSFDFSGATVTNNGIVDPSTTGSSSSIRTMTISGDFPFGASSTTLIELGMYSYFADKITITGTANIGGTLDVSMYNYTPVLGDSWEIITAASVSGTFDTETLPPLDPGLEWYVNYNSNSVILEVVLAGTLFNDLTVILDGSGSGSVTSDPVGIDCVSTCSDSFVAGNLVTLSATADTGSVFVGWSGDTDCEDGVVTLDTTVSCIATFELDSDGDGLLDSIEASLGTNPNEPDSDFDGMSDFAEVNRDGDPASYSVGADTDPNNPDTDGDGYYDGAENSYGTDPLDSGDISSIIRVSTNSNGLGANQNSGDDAPSISSDGRYVAFYTWATNLVDCNTNAYNDVYLKDSMTGRTTIQSTNSNGDCVAESYVSSSLPDISSDGRYVVFESNVTTLVANDTNGSMSDIFLKDTQTGTTTLVSTDSNGTQANEGCESPAVSGDGRYVVFRSYADNLVPGDTNEDLDIFLKDTLTGTTTRMNTDSSGAQANSSGDFATISSDGRYVVFTSYADNLVAGDTNDATDVFIKNIETGETTRVSTDSSGVQGDDDSDFPAVSSDGRYVVFASDATNLVEVDTNGLSDIFLKDTITDVTTRVSADSNGAESNGGDSQVSDISGDGRYVVFDSYANNLVAGDTNATGDIFLKDTVTGVTTLVSKNNSGIQGNNLSELPVISSDGNFIAFRSAASNLVGDIEGFVDMFRVVNPLVRPTYYDLSITLAGSGSGTVTSDPAGIDCGATCTNAFLAGTLISLYATADTGSVFVSGSGDPDCEDGEVTMNKSISCVATFELDGDGDGVPDILEDTNMNGIVDVGETDPYNPDTDSDGFSDGDEDANHNGVVDPGETDPRNADSDNDGLSDGVEVNILGTNPLLTDTDGNGTPDGDEDNDGDGLTNVQEVKCGSDPGNPNSKCGRFLPFLMLLLD